MGRNYFSLIGKVALVTGGSRGIGLAIAKGLAQNGADVAIVARTKKRLEEAKKEIQRSSGRDVWIFPFDMGDTGRIEQLFKRIVSKTGGVDILVNCAGENLRAKAEETGIKDWDRVMKVNLTAVFVMSQAFCRARKKAGLGGKIINIGSLMCHGARPTTSAYASSKGGLLMLTRSLAVEWAKYNINVNAIGPGYIATDLTAKLKADRKFSEWVVSKTPVGRWGRAEDLAGAAVFLASSASEFVTGQILYVDGGWLAGL